MPPTAAATRPACSGAPVASAMPSESGSAMRKTVTDAERSAPQSLRGGRALPSLPPLPGPSDAVLSLVDSVEREVSTMRTEGQADIVSPRAGGTVRGVWLLQVPVNEA